MELEPGPLTLIDLGDFGQTFEPPTLAPLAASFVQSMTPLHDALDVAYATLAAEAALDLGDISDGAISSLGEPGAFFDTGTAADEVNRATDTYAASVTLLNQLENFLPKPNDFIVVPTLDGRPPGTPKGPDGKWHTL